MDVWRAPIRAPFRDDHDDEIPKDAVQEQDLRDEFRPDGHHVAKVDKVGQLKTNGKRHLRKKINHDEIKGFSWVGQTYVYHAEDDAHLHLVTVDEDQAILCTVPRRIDSKGVCVPICDSFHRAGLYPPSARYI